MIGCNSSEGCAARPATARLDREFDAAQPEGWLDRAAAQFRAAITFNIPVGYENETGFHCGVQRAPARISAPVPDRENDFTEADKL
jgi:hypothetical protein